MPNIFKMSNAGGFKSLTRYWNMLTNNTTWNPYTPEGSFYEIAKYTVPSGGVAAVTLTVPSGYRHLELQLSCQSNKSTYGIDSFKITFNNDTSASYSQHEIYADGVGSTVNAGASSSQTSIYVDTTNATAATDTFSANIFSIQNYASSNTKVIRILSSSDHNGAIAGYYGQVAFGSGAWYNSSAITSIKIAPWVGTLWNEFSKFTLIGIK